MIIRVTCGDNDFDRVLRLFMNSLYIKVTGVDICQDFSLDEHKRFSRMLNPNVDYPLTDQDREDLVSKIRSTFEKFVKFADPEFADYLVRRLEINILNSFEDKWENGEAYYWLQHSGLVVNQ